MDSPQIGLLQQAAAEQSLGDTALDQRNTAAAAPRYRQCLHLLNRAADNQIVALLQNLAIAHMQLQHHAEAFMCAVAVLALFPNNSHPKACFHAAKAAAAMALAAAAVWLLEHIPISRNAPAVVQLAATLDVSIGSKLKVPVLNGAELAHAILYASIQLPDPAPHSNMLQTTSAAKPAQPEKPSSPTDATPDAVSHSNFSSAAVEQLQCVAQLKQEGTSLFQAGDACGAVAKWGAALASLDMLSQVVPRLAQAENDSQAGRQESRTALTCVALMWAPRDVGLHAVRAAHAAAVSSAAEPPQVPVLCVEQALRMLPEDSSLLDQHRALQKPLQEYTKRAAEAMAGKSSAERRHECEAVGTADHALGMAMKQQMQGLMASRPEMRAAMEKAAGGMPEDFDRVFLQSGPLPRGCDAQACRDHLAIGAKDAYMHWTMLVTPALGAIKSSSQVDGAGSADPLGGRDNVVITPGTLSVRFHGDFVSRMHWWQHAPLGSVAWRLPTTYHDGSEKLHSFSNVLQHGFPLRGGGVHVHVGVGFVDLGHVAETLVDTARRGERLHLHWTGLDASAHACALTLVIVQMLQAGAPVDCIVQVWYSAAWTKEALQHFRSAIAAVLERCDSLDPAQQEQAELSPGVQAWLHKWATAEVPLKQARKQWLKRQLKSSASIANACSSRDRRELCAYRLTGQLLDADTGSVPMFAMLQQPGVHFDYTDEEHVLDTIAPDALMRAHRGLKPGERTLMGAGLAVVRERVRALQTAVQAGTLRLRVLHTTVSATDLRTLSRIAALRPDSMSWSNVAEYMQPQTFHHLARRCSLPHTRHFLHAMNWATTIKGAFVMDYCEAPRSSAATVKQRCGIAKKAYQAIEMYRREVGGEGVFRHPVLDNRMNVTDAMLARQQHRRWLEAFVRKCQAGVPVSYVVLHEPGYWYFSRADTVVHFELRYC